MKYLIVDTETNGLPQCNHLPVTDLPNWPRLISVAWGLYDDEGHELSRHYELVKPEGFRWNKVAQRIHRISQEQAERKGKPLTEVLEQLWQDTEKADAWVGHNISFDCGVIGAEFLRMQKAQPGRVGELPARPLLCTMEASAHVTANRVPTRLDELYHLLTGKRMKGMHDASADMLATAKCFFELKRSGYFETEEIERHRSS
ncbi:3'-5' exonuclease [Salmonirosea aquatica]|uniref:3'-5' exonuclease n=1 Tax=Salmonirosea aquatica TaxID=2654236 RepID=A0A7C9F1X2_9BACT|nr:3'-5' exonuclease [Cytophagaceae bacterium SJW1-29]